MLNLIDQLIGIDKDARSQVERAENRAKEILEEAERDCGNLRSEYAGRAEKRLSIVEESYSKIAGEEISVILDRERKRAESLEKVMEQNKAAWEKEILSRIIGVHYESVL